MIHTDIIIIGSGPVGLFTVFEAGLMKLKCHLIDALPKVGGQLSEIYPKKPIYDIPGFPSILAGELINNLLTQASPFHPGFTLGDRAEKIKKMHSGEFIVTSASGILHHAPVIIIAGGLGSFEPRKPQIKKIKLFEGKGLEYMVKDPKKFKNKNLIISGGGDSALDWAIYFAKDYAKSVILVHRSDKFRAHKDSLEEIYNLEKKKKIRLIKNAEVVDLFSDQVNEIDDNENNCLTSIKIKYLNENEKYKNFKADYWLPLFGFSPKLGPISNWGLTIHKSAIVVNNSLDYQTNIPGIFAVGDINTYPGKLKLILCGFHEATIAVQKSYKIIYPNKKITMKYTTINGIEELN